MQHHGAVRRKQRCERLKSCAKRPCIGRCSRTCSARLQRPLDPSPLGPRQPVRHPRRAGRRHRARLLHRHADAAPAHPAHHLALALPPLPLAAAQAQPATAGRSSRVKPGQTLGARVRRTGHSRHDHARACSAPDAKPALTPAASPAPNWRSTCPSTAACARCAIDRDDDAPRRTGVRRRPVRENVHRAPDLTTRTVVLSGKVGKSLFQSARKLGLAAAQHQHADRRDLQVRHRLRRGPRRRRPLQRGGRPDLARRRAGQHRPGAGRHLHHRTASCRARFRFVRNGKAGILHRRRPFAEEELHPHADPVCAPDLRLRRAPPSGARPHAHAQGRGLRRRHRHADHGRRRCARGSSSAGRAATAAR